VDRDRSMEAMAESGDAWMQPMIEFRDFLASTQDPAHKPDQRSLVRRDGRVWIKEGKLIYGPYDFEFRQELLRRLLRTQVRVRELGPEPEMMLIQPEELHAIRRIWRSEENDWADVLPKIYHEETGETLDWVRDDHSLFGTVEESLLREVCEARDVPMKLVQQLLGIEQEYEGMRRRHRIYHKIDAAFNRDWRSDEEIWASVPRGETAKPGGKSR
jgi:DNA sulfur modification protein DndC